jgi:hypothetical protein
MPLCGFLTQLQDDGVEGGLIGVPRAAEQHQRASVDETVAMLAHEPGQGPFALKDVLAVDAVVAKFSNFAKSRV